ncbi:hypothetical protein CRE_11291 [Caenorhabditis remanei]|uniref:Uncharacterized protein n=1 Tax=Caenorhabditis remanei TaxID=31234 RepID=E3N0D4_CAERE|nr:hypothetical protein CRE_11291 [Caenorhabditis remanei]
MILRNVSKSLRNLDDQKEDFKCESIDIRCYKDYIRGRFNYEDVIYAATSWRMPIDYENWANGHSKVIRSADYKKIACDQLKYVLTKRKLRLNRLCIGTLSNVTEFSQFKCFESLFSSIGRKDVHAVEESDAPYRTINDDLISIRRQSSDTMDNAFVNSPSADMSTPFDPSSMTPNRTRTVASYLLSQLLARNAPTSPPDKTTHGSGSLAIAGTERRKASSSEMRRKRPRMEESGSEGNTEVSTNPFDMSRWSCMQKMLDPISFMMVNIELRDEDDTSLLESEARRISTRSRELYTTVRDKLDTQETLRKFLSCPLFVNDFKQHLNHIGEA